MAPPRTSTSTRTEGLEATFTPSAISGDGRVVVGEAFDSDVTSLVGASWSESGGIAELPPLSDASARTAGIAANCDGSVLLARDASRGDIYRVEAGRAQQVLGDSPRLATLSMNADGSAVIDGTGPATEVDGSVVAVPQRWSAPSGAVPLTAVSNASLHRVALDGSFIGSNADALFRYRPQTRQRERIGFAPLNGEGALVVNRAGTAWIESDDERQRSFVVWRTEADPISVSCPGVCRLKALSGDGQVALIDLVDGTAVHSALWTERGGFIDLAEQLRRGGFDVGQLTLRASAMSDDARAFAGTTYDAEEHAQPSSFFYAVLPADADG
ncbi:MAG TPA: hypothetical protein VEQ59_21990 [Polyangiaceae bacterium]|nr:hypothetical protein [Polyangiaceae bacterium]